MALNIKNPQVEQLATDVAAMTGESKTEAIRTALVERKARLRLARAGQDRAASLLRLLQEEIWPEVSERARRRPWTKADEERVLGFGPEGA